MSDTIEARYVGPDTEGMTLQPVVGAAAGRSFVCPHGEWVELPAELVIGTEHTYADGYDVPDDPADVDSDHITAHGIEGLIALEYVDADGERQPCWQVRKKSKSKNTAPKTDPAATTEGLNDGDSVGT